LTQILLMIAYVVLLLVFGLGVGAMSANKYHIFYFSLWGIWIFVFQLFYSTSHLQRSWYERFRFYHKDIFTSYHILDADKKIDEIISTLSRFGTALTIFIAIISVINIFIPKIKRSVKIVSILASIVSLVFLLIFGYAITHFHKIGG